MDINTYISSGILELYVLGILSAEENAAVEEMQSKHVEVKREIYEISIALEKYGQIHGVTAPVSLESRIMDLLPKKDPKSSNQEKTKTIKNKPINWKFLTLLFGLTSIVGMVMYSYQGTELNKELKAAKKSLLICDSISQQLNSEYALLQQLGDPQNEIIAMSSTENYQDIAIYLYHNKTSKRNIIQLNIAPNLVDEQTFQLWALKPGADPMPLEIFTTQNRTVSVAYVDDTATYAVTIEPKGGSLVPSLDKLIGTWTVI